MPATPPFGSPNLQRPQPEQNSAAPAAPDWTEPDLTENGLTLARRFYESCGAPLLAERVPDLADRIAAGLVGEGSDCFGLDDAISRDHDWGPAFCLWLSEEDLAVCSQRLEAALADLPESFAGWPARMRPELRGGRVGPLAVERFYARFINRPRPPEGWREWRLIPEHFLAVATNGEVFSDPAGKFTAFREALLAFYPEDVRLKKIAARCAKMAQSGQYNLPRVLRRGDRVAALLCIAEFSRQALSLAFLLNRRYMPFYKWAFRAAADLPTLGQEVRQGLERLVTLPWNAEAPTAPAQTPAPIRAEDAADAVEEVCAILADALRRQGLSDGQSDWLLEHAPRIQSAIETPELRRMPFPLE